MAVDRRKHFFSARTRFPTLVRPVRSKETNRARARGNNTAATVDCVYPSRTGDFPETGKLAVAESVRGERAGMATRHVAAAPVTHPGKAGDGPRGSRTAVDVSTRDVSSCRTPARTTDARRRSFGNSNRRRSSTRLRPRRHHGAGLSAARSTPPPPDGRPSSSYHLRRPALSVRNARSCCRVYARAPDQSALVKTCQGTRSAPDKQTVPRARARTGRRRPDCYGPRSSHRAPQSSRGVRAARNERRAQ